MNREFIDKQGLGGAREQQLRNAQPPADIPFDVTKLGHVVLHVANLARSTEFYRDVLGFKVSDVYPDSMMPGGMVFMRFAADHHSLALVGAGNAGEHKRELHHLAFEVATLDEVVLARDHLRAHDVTITYEGRRRAGCQVSVEFLDPDGYALEIYWGLDQVGPDGRSRPPDEWKPSPTLAGAIADPPNEQDTTLIDRTLVP